MSPRQDPFDDAASAGARASAGAVLRTRLVDAAAELLAERQVSAITTRDIARTAGLSDGVLYNYFSNKNDLLAEALLRGYGEQVEGFGSRLPVAGTETVEKNLLQFADAMLTLAEATLPVVTGLVAEPALMHRFIADIHGAQYGPLMTLGRVETYLGAEQKLGRLGAFDASAAATLFIGSIIALGVSGMVGEDHVPAPRSQLPVLIETLLSGLGR